MTIEELKEKVLTGAIESGIYASDDKIVLVDNNGFTIKTMQANGWTRLDIYEYLDNEWVYSESYER